MKRTLYGLVAVLLFSLTVGICARAQQSLGEVARHQRESRHPSAAKVYTNDDFAPVPAASEPAATDKAEKSEAATAAKAGEKKAEEKTEDKTKAAADLKANVEDQKKNIAQMEHELDIAQREYRLKVAVYYSDAGNSLRDSKKWAEEDRKQRAEIESKQKAINDAKQKLDSLQEEARKAGVRTE